MVDFLNSILKCYKNFNFTEENVKFIEKEKMNEKYTGYDILLNKIKIKDVKKFKRYCSSQRRR